MLTVSDGDTAIEVEQHGESAWLWVKSAEGTVVALAVLDREQYRLLADKLRVM